MGESVDRGVNYAGGVSSEIELACPIPVPRLKLAEVTPELQKLIDAGSDPRFIRTLGHAPGSFAAWGAFYGKMLHQGVLSLRLKETARLRIAALNGCHY